MPEVSVEIVRDRINLCAYDAVILPGTRNTVASLNWLRSCGLAAEVNAASRAGVYTLAICGGMQMLGNHIHDPLGLESGGDVDGLGLLDLHTLLTETKTTRQITVTISDTHEVVDGYEIHHGVTTAGSRVVPELDDGLGWSAGNVTGIYVHGLLDTEHYLRRFLRRIGVESVSQGDRAATLDAEFNGLARAVDDTGWTTRIEALLANPARQS